jgi:hypothetical protein
MQEAFAQSWENFMMLVAGVIRSLGIVIPLGLAAMFAWGFMRRFKTGRHKVGPYTIGVNALGVSAPSAPAGTQA